MKLSEIWENFDNKPLAHLATQDENQPRVRVITLITYKKGLWFVTVSKRSKLAQIKKNNRIEISLSYGKNMRGCIRITGKAIIIEDLTIKKQFAEENPRLFSNENPFWKSYEDPAFNLLRIDINKVVIQNPPF